jgi:hypothetical protein
VQYRSAPANSDVLQADSMWKLYTKRWPSGTLRRVVWCKFTDVSGVLTTSETSASFYYTTRSSILEERPWEPLNSHTPLFSLMRAQLKWQLDWVTMETRKPRYREEKYKDRVVIALCSFTFRQFVEISGGSSERKIV